MDQDNQELQQNGRNEAGSRLTLTSDEAAKLGSFAKDNKFDLKGVSILYSDDPTQKLDYFIKAHRFISNLSRTEIDETLQKKLAEFADTTGTAYHEALRLFELNKTCIGFNRHRIRRKVFTFLQDNRGVIEPLLDVVFPLGRVTKLYDPAKTQGYY